MVFIKEYKFIFLEPSRFRCIEIKHVTTVNSLGVRNFITNNIYEYSWDKLKPVEGIRSILDMLDGFITKIFIIDIHLLAKTIN